MSLLNLSRLGEEGLGLNDIWLGLILLAFSLALLCGCLISLMKILNSMMGSKMADIICKTINADIPYVPWLTGYLGMLVGAVITILVRSSSVFTSTLTPLCGAGEIITLMFNPSLDLLNFLHSNHFQCSE